MRPFHQRVFQSAPDGSRTVTNTLDGQVASESFDSGPMFDGATVTRAFDGLLRTGTLSVTPPGGSAIVQTVAYDAASRFQTFTQDTLTATYTYEPNSSLVAGVTLQNSGTTTMTTAKTYDRLNRLKSISSGVGSSVVSSHTYLTNKANQRIRATLADGSYWIYEYDGLGQVTKGNKYWPNGAPVNGQQFGYAFDGIGNRTSTTTNGRTADYTPNALNQYEQRDVPGAFEVLGTASPTATVSLTGTGIPPTSTNRNGSYFAGAVTVTNTGSPVYETVTITGVKAASGTYREIVTTATGTMFVAQTPEVFSHDLDGNLIRDGRWNYTWDAENRLVQLETTGSAVNAGAPKQKLTFAYDWMGRRAEKVLLQATGTNDYATIAITRFLYDGWNLVAELDGNNATLRTYLWGLDLSGSPQGAGGVGGLVAMTTTGPPARSYFVYYDGNGNVLGLVAASGTPAATYEYGPFGEPVRVSGAMAGVNPMRFSTNYTDPETRRVNGKRRWYDSDAGRFLSRDPIGEKGGINPFSYCAGNPVGLFDPLGLTHFCIGDKDVAKALLDINTRLDSSDIQNMGILDFMAFMITFDTPFRLNHSRDTYNYHGNDYVLLLNSQFTGSELNYLGIGAALSYRGYTQDGADDIIKLWKSNQYNTAPSNNTFSAAHTGYQHARKGPPQYVYAEF